MPDDADLANDLISDSNNAAILNARRNAAEIPAGNPGDCWSCGEYSKRLVNGACASCRDKYEID